MSSTTPTSLAPSPAVACAGLELVLCPDWESLADDLCRDLSSPLEDPFETVLVLSGAPAVRRALSQRLAAGQPSSAGICAGVEFTSLRQARRRLEQDLLGIDPGTDPWRRRGLALAVLDVMEEVGDQPWFLPVAHHLGDANLRPGRRLATAERIARLLRRYVTTCPELLVAWSRDELVCPDGSPLGEQRLWQARIWNLVRDRLDIPDPVARHRALLEALRQDSSAPLLSEGGVLRLVDPTPCEPLDRELVTALAARMPVRLWQLTHDEGSPLARRWGAARRAGIERWEQAASGVRRLPPGAPPDSLLGAVQAEVLGLPVAPVGDAPDASVQVHASHGPDRQVEVLREVLLGLMQADESLEPREVVVACTDLDTYAPLVRATFCLDEQVVGEDLHPGHRLRVQLADASLEQPNQVLEVLRRLLHLAGDRATAQDLVDLCTATPVSTRFDLGPDDLDRITRLVASADVRWGLDVRHRGEFGLSQVRQSTWLAGVERICVGIAMGTQPLRWLGTALPVDQVESSDVMAAGSLAEVVSRVRKVVAGWRTPAPVQEWISRLHEALDLLMATDTDDAWQLSTARGELADLADLTVDRTAALGLGDLQALFDRLLRTGRGRPNFGNGSLLVCGLDDLADVRHRVVAVLGLDDQRFPARPAQDGDDLSRLGEHDPELDPRARSRELLLDALMAASETFVVVHQGRTARTNEPVPRPVPVIDLLDACERHGSPVVATHSLQPQSAANFNAAPDEPPFSFDRGALAGAQARDLLAQHPVEPPPPLWQVPLGQPPVATEVDLGELVDFYRHPARELLRRSLGVTMGRWDDELPDELPIEPDSLQEWAIGDRMVRLALDGLDPQQVAAAERLRGELPPGQLGARTLNKLMPQVTRVVNATLRERGAPAVDLDCELPLDQVLLTGRVRVHDSTVVSHAFSRTNAATLMTAWLNLLLLSATRPAPAAGWRAVHVGRDALCTLLAPPAERSAQLLAEMTSLRAAGLAQLVPLPIRAAAAFQRLTPVKPWRPEDPEVVARRDFRHEHDADWARFVGDDLDALRRLEAQPGDPGLPGGSRFENLSDWMFTPIREQLSVGNLR